MSAKYTKPIPTNVVMTIRNAFATLSDGKCCSSVREPVVHTNDSMETKNEIIDQANQTAGSARRIQTFQKIAV